MEWVLCFFQDFSVAGPGRTVAVTVGMRHSPEADADIRGSRGPTRRPLRNGYARIAAASRRPSASYNCAIVFVRSAAMPVVTEAPQTESASSGRVLLALIVGVLLGFA